MQSGSSQGQVVCISSSPTHGPVPHFVLKPAPSAAKYRNKRRLLLTHSPSPSSSTPRRLPSTAASSHRNPCTPPALASFLNFFDTPSTIQPQKSNLRSPKSASAFSFLSASPSPIVNPKRHARAFDVLPFTLAPTPTAQVEHSSVYSDSEQEEEPRYSSEATLYDPANEEPDTQAKDPEQRLKENAEHFTFLRSDPYSPPAIHKYSCPHGQPPHPLSLSPLSLSGRKRSLSASSFATLKYKNPFTLKSFPNPFKNLITMPSSSSSSSSSTRPSSSRKAPEKVLPFTTQQIAELDRLMGNSKASKGKVASQYAPGAHSSSSEKHYIAPYVPLNGSAPSGTRSFGRDGEHHPIGASTGMSKREVGVKGESIPYMRDENGVMWSGQEEMDEYQQLLDQAEARRRRKAAISHIDTRRSSEDSWKQFPPSASSVDSSSDSILRSAGSTEVFDLGYDDAVMIPEGGAVRLAAVSTVGGLTKVSGPVTLGHSTRGVESFPAPQPTSTTRSGPTTPRPRGADRRIRPGTTPQPAADPVDGRAGASQTSLGTIRPVLPLDQEGKMEFFGDAFAPPPAAAPQRSVLPPLQPIQPSATWGQQPQPSPVLGGPKSKLHRHSTSLAVGSANFFQSLVNAHGKGNDMPGSPLSPTSPSYLAPLPHPDKYSGIRQASFSGPGGFAAKGSLRSPTFAPPPVPALPPQYAAENLKALKKKSSGLNVAQMFKKLTKV